MSLDSWQWCNPQPQGNPLDSIARGSNNFIAVSRAGTVLSSTDGTSWTFGVPLASASIPPVGLGQIRYFVGLPTAGSGMFVVVGNSGTIMLVPDNGVWSQVPSGTRSALMDVAYGNGRLVAVGNCDTITTSTDGGQTWVAGSSGIASKADEDYFGVAYGNGVFVAVGRNGTILTSPDGTTWSDHSLPAPIDLIASIDFGLGTFVAVTDSRKMWSTNGSGWSMSSAVADVCLTGVRCVGGRFVATGSRAANSLSTGLISMSNNGSSWSDTFIGDEPLFDAAYHDNKFVVCGLAGTIRTSVDGGQTWVPQNTDNSPIFFDVAYGGGNFVAVGGHRGAYGQVERAALWRSANGGPWVPVVPPASLANEPLWTITYTGSNFVALGGWTTALTSPDGATWTTTNQHQGAEAVAYNPGTGTLVAANGHRLCRSTNNAVTWTATLSTSNTDDWFDDIAYGPNVFVAVGYRGIMWWSQDDGKTWHAVANGPDEDMRGVAYGNNMFVAAAASGFIWTSTDGKTWQSGTAVASVIGSCYGLDYVAGMFMLLGHALIATSLDGVDWQYRPSGDWNALFSAASGNGTVVAVGSSGTILQASTSTTFSLKALTASPRPPYRQGGRITWTCSVTGDDHGRLRYAFTVTPVKAPPRGAKTEMAPAIDGKFASMFRQPAAEKTLHFQTNPTFVQRLDEPGTFIVTAYVRDAEGYVVEKSSPAFEVSTRTAKPGPDLPERPVTGRRVPGRISSPK